MLPPIDWLVHGIFSATSSYRRSRARQFRRPKKDFRVRFLSTVILGGAIGQLGYHYRTAFQWSKDARSWRAFGFTWVASASKWIISPALWNRVLHHVDRQYHLLRIYFRFRTVSQWNRDALSWLTLGFTWVATVSKWIISPTLRIRAPHYVEGQYHLLSIGFCYRTASQWSRDAWSWLSFGLPWVATASTVAHLTNAPLLSTRVPNHVIEQHHFLGIDFHCWTAFTWSEEAKCRLSLGLTGVAPCSSHERSGIEFWITLTGGVVFVDIRFHCRILSPWIIQARSLLTLVCSRV